MGEHQLVLRGERGELVGCGDERQAGDRGDFLRHRFGKPIGRVEPGADRGAALRELVEAGQRLFDPLDARVHLRGVTREPLPQGERGRVLRMCAADLDDIAPRVRLRRQVGVHRTQRGEQMPHHLARRGDVDRARERVVRALAHVDVVVGMDRCLRADHSAEHLDRAVGDHLVGVHVRLRTRAGLPHDERKFGVELAVDHFLRRADDRVGELAIEHTQVAIGFGRRALDRAQGANKRHRHRLAADAKVLQRALRLCAPQVIGGDLDGAEGIALGTGLSHPLPR